MREMRDPGCDNDNVSPTPAQQAQATRIAAELAALGFALPGTLADRMTRCGHAELPLPRRPAPPARPLPPMDPQKKRENRHPHPVRRPARRLRPLVRQPPPPARTGHRTGGTQPHHRRSRPPLETLPPPGTATPASHAEPERRSPDSVATPRLTCRPDRKKTTSTQVSPKREDLTSSTRHFERRCSGSSANFQDQETSEAPPLTAEVDSSACLPVLPGSGWGS